MKIGPELASARVKRIATLIKIHSESHILRQERSISTQNHQKFIESL